MRKLYFIRHGETEHNVANKISGDIETPLTEKGRDQARQAGWIARDLKINLIVSSPYSRALDTAKIIAEEIGMPESQIKVNELFVERKYGQLEGKPYPPGYNHEIGAKLYGVESDEELVARARKALDWLEGLPYDNILVSGHGSFGRALRSLVKEDFPMSFPKRIINAEILEFL